MREFSFEVYRRLPLPCTQSNLPPRATSHGVATTTSGNSFVDPGNSFNILDEIDDVDTKGYAPDYLNQDRIEGRFSNATNLCSNDEKWLKSITLLTDIVTIARQFRTCSQKALSVIT